MIEKEKVSVTCIKGMPVSLFKDADWQRVLQDTWVMHIALRSVSHYDFTVDDSVMICHSYVMKETDS